MKHLRPRLTYANVVATLALFIALGGASYAAVRLPKDSVGTEQIQNGAITEVKIANGAVTGAKISGAVPSATHADSAGNAKTANHADSATTAKTANHADSATTAKTANHADSATSAKSAISAEHARTASHARNADTVTGKTAAEITAESQLHCPKDTILLSGNCFDSADRPAATALEALSSCAKDGMELPSFGQLSSLVVHLKKRGTIYRVDSLSVNEKRYFSGGLYWLEAGGNPFDRTAEGLRFAEALEDSPLHFRCVTRPVN